MLFRDLDLDHRGCATFARPCMMTCTPTLANFARESNVRRHAITATTTPFARRSTCRATASFTFASRHDGTGNGIDAFFFFLQNHQNHSSEQPRHNHREARTSLSDLRRVPVPDKPNYVLCVAANSSCMVMKAPPNSPRRRRTSRSAANDDTALRTLKPLRRCAAFGSDHNVICYADYAFIHFEQCSVKLRRRLRTPGTTPIGCAQRVVCRSAVQWIVAVLYSTTPGRTQGTRPRAQSSAESDVLFNSNQQPDTERPAPSSQ